jgi:acyl-CoA synthetase (NDP forming)
MTATAELKRRAISRLLRPRSVAVVGASAMPGALGASVIANLDRMGFTGEIHLINPKREEIGGRRCLRSVDDLPIGIDVAVLAIPRAAVLDTIQALARREAGAAIIFSAGFAEGGEAGLLEQREIARVATDSGMVIEGPNCLGLVNYVDGVALTFVETPATILGNRRGIALVSQSGAMAAVLGVTLASRDLGISYSISTGNEAASGVEDYVDYLLDDPSTAVVGMIVEQFRQPARFLELAWSARRAGKTIILLHPGRSSAARESAATHTGAMAGEYAVMRLHVERHGVLMAESLEEFGDLLEVALRCRIPPSGGTVVLTESGAFKALSLDLSEQIGLRLPTLTDTSAPALRATLPEFVQASNPIDLTAQALIDPDLYRRTLSALLPDERFGSIVFGIIQTDATTSRIKFPPIIGAIRDLQPHKPIIFAGLDEGAAVPSEYVRQLRELGVPYFPSPERALRAVARWVEWSAREAPLTDTTPLTFAATLPASGVVPEYRSKVLLRSVGIAFPIGRLVHTPEQAQEVASQIGFPVVLKAQSAELSHKSDAGGVVLGLNDSKDLTAGWDSLHANLSRHRPGMVLEGVLVEKQGNRGLELIVGARNDADWGPIILVGMGGVQAELLADVRMLPADLSTDAIARELGQLKCSALLRGYRGSPALDVGAVVRLVAQLGRLMLSQPAIREIDLNPVVVYPEGQGAVALDALMLWDGSHHRVDTIINNEERDHA